MRATAQRAGDIQDGRVLLLLSGEGHSTVWWGQVHPSKEVHAACGLRAKLEPHRVPGDPKLLTQPPQPQCSHL